MKTEERLLDSLRDVRELETFLHDLLGNLTLRGIETARGEDLMRYVKVLGLSVPEAIRDMAVTWDTHHGLAEAGPGKESSLVLVKPGHPDALGLTIGCVRVGRFKICLECGWLYCRIVIKGTF
jgi:hypothetical protein